MKQSFKHHPDNQYLNLLRDVRDNGVLKEDRTGTGTKSVFSRTMRFDIRDGKIPLLTTKKVFTKGLIHELLWFLSGDTNIRYLKANGVDIWDSWIKKGTEEYRELTVDERIGLANEIIKREEAEWRVSSADQMCPEQCTFRYIVRECMFPPDIEDETVHQYLDRKFTTKLVPRKVLIAGELGPVYGKQWRSWEDVRITDNVLEDGAKMLANGYTFMGSLLTPDDLSQMCCNGSQAVWKRTIDQIAVIIDQLKNNPDSRRIILNAWNVAYLAEMGLPPCHLMLQFYTEPMTEQELKNQLKENDIGFSPMELVGVEPGTKAGLDFWTSKTEQFGLPTRWVSAELHCRSQDLPLGTPFNIAQYGVLIHMVAQVCNLNTKEFIWSGGDCHIYLNQFEGVEEQLSREPVYSSVPKVKLNKSIKYIDQFTFDDIEIVDYYPRPVIKFPQAAV